jgi:aryl-alcohol dehydrogenase-like predicted oxidoreductase
MIASDGSAVERAAYLGIAYFDTARGYQSGNNERMVGAAMDRVMSLRYGVEVSERLIRAQEMFTC